MAVWPSVAVWKCGKDGSAGGMMADTHNGAGASQRIVSQVLATIPAIHCNNALQC